MEPPSDTKSSSSYKDTNIFIIVVLVCALFIMGVLIANVVYFGKLRKNSSNSAIDKTQANNMYSLNIVMMLPVIVVVCYAIFKLVVGARKYNDYKSRAGDYVQDRYTASKNWAVAPVSGYSRSSRSRGPTQTSGPPGGIEMSDMRRR